ncbi:hypothetical protein [Sphingomonas radiodurans]|uniref:hypothetical protein n=1 Tax=Sphingomonas radiodurans TaxID=2890321 RepID=UPI001E61ADE2|nr:hypothetical protein [Sphingomonas radiodurans]WBH17927.1 hypothetical protein LLW23_07495 [Sphingomonas radiodurans]
MDARWLDRYRLLVLLAVAIAARAATFGNPIVHVDEDFYFTAAQAMWRGAIPYVDVWDRKPVGLFLVYLLPTALPFVWGILAYQAMALAAVVGTAWIIARLATLGGWARGATLSGIAYILWLNVAGGQGGQSPIFYNPLVAGAGWLIVANKGRRWWRDAAAMLLVGIALQIKYSAVFEGLFFGLWIMIHDWRARKRIVRLLVRATALAVIALLPTAGAIGAYAAIGQLDAFLFANFLSISSRGIDPPLERWSNLGKLVLFLAPLVAMAVDSVRQAPGGSIERRFMLWWFGTALAGIVIFGGWYDHYALPAFVPGAICAGGFFAGRRRGGAYVLALVAVIGQVTVIANRIGRGGPAEFDALIAAIGSGPGCLWVYSGTPKIYAAADRCRVTKYIFPSHLYRTRESGAIGVPQAVEVRRILGEKPAAIIMRPRSIGERFDIRSGVERVIARDYFVAARRQLGSETLTIYKRR